MNNNRINLTSEEFCKLATKKIGEGYDAIVYNAPKGKVFKVYKKEDISVDDDLGVKKYKRGDFKNFPKKIYRLSYVDKEDIIIYYKDAADKITERQELISKTNLPVSSLYVDNEFVGFVLKKVNGIQLHIAWMILPRKTKIKVLKELLSKVKELTDNFVYPTDMANSPFVGKHSNVLINIKLEPKIIDLDGISTSYREKEDKNLLRYTLSSMNLLYLELLLGFDLFEDLEDINTKYIEELLKQINIDEESAHRLSEFEGNYDDLNKLILAISKKK